MKKLHKISLVLFMLIYSASAVTIKIGSIAPQGSPWDDGLQQLASEWNRISDGDVQLRIYPGGIAGDEEDMLRKMQANLLGGAALTSLGMNELYPGILASALPLIYESDEEFEYVFEQISPHYEAELEEQGVKMIIWAQVGWVHVFAKNPVTSVEDMRQEKLFVYAGDGRSVTGWRNVGFNPVPLSVNDVMTSLQSGMVSSFITSPLSAAALQWFGLAQNMADMQWAPLMGGIIINKRVWDRIDPTMQAELLTAAENIGVEMQGDIDQAEMDAIETMQEYGLQIHHVTDEERVGWKIVSDQIIEEAVGTIVDEAGYNLVQQHIQEYRAQNQGE